MNKIRKLGRIGGVKVKARQFIQLVACVLH